MPLTIFARAAPRERPSAVQDLGARTVEAHRVVPALHDRQAVGDLAVAAAELDGDRAVRALLRRDVVDRVGVVLVRLEVALGVVDADRPEAVDRHVLDVELVDRRAVVLGRRDVEIDGILVRIAAPGRRGSDQVPDRIDLILGAERLLKSGKVVPSTSSASRTFFWLAGSQFGTSKLAGTRLLDLDRILQRVDLLRGPPDRPDRPACGPPTST